MQPAVPTDAIHAARLGSGWAFEGIYNALAGPVRRFLAAQGASDPEASTQEAFLRVFRGIDRFDGDSDHLRSWVFTVARNLLIDERRAAGRRPVPTIAPLPYRADARSQDDLVAGIEADQVRAILDRLPADQREVVVLRFVVDRSLHEVAAVTGRSLAAVKGLQHRGLDRLRRLVEDPARSRAPFPVAQTFTST